MSRRCEMLPGSDPIFPLVVSRRRRDAQKIHFVEKAVRDTTTALCGVNVFAFLENNPAGFPAEVFEVCRGCLRIAREVAGTPEVARPATAAPGAPTLPGDPGTEGGEKRRPVTLPGAWPFPNRERSETPAQRLAREKAELVEALRLALKWAGVRKLRAEVETGEVESPNREYLEDVAKIRAAFVNHLGGAL